MSRHALQAVPWRLLGLAAVLVPLLLRTVEAWPYTVWPLQGIAVGLLAGTTAWVYDEPSAALVDTLPRHLAWRTVARSVAVVVLVGCWLASVAWTRTAYFGHAGDVAVQGCVAVVATTAYVTWLRRAGRATPGGLVGPGVVAGSAFIALARPFNDQVPVFPYTGTDPWSQSTAGWLVAGVLSLVTLAWALHGSRGMPRVRG